MANKLTTLAIRHGSEKFGTHDYTGTYWDLFKDLQTAKIRLLEIGIGGGAYPTEGGGSLAMWRDFFVNGTITGIDSSEKQLELGPRVACWQGTQQDLAFMDEIHARCGPFDIIIDTGIQSDSEVLRTFEHCFPQLASGGYYVVENLRSAVGKSGSSPDQRSSATADYLARLFTGLERDDASSTVPHASVHAIHRYQDLIAVRKRDDTSPPAIGSNSIPQEVFEDILSSLTMTRGSMNHNRLGVLFDFLLKSGHLVRAESVLQSIQRHPPVPRSYFDRGILLAEARGQMERVKALREERDLFLDDRR